jgi:hypothetical protein
VSLGGAKPVRITIKIRKNVTGFMEKNLEYIPNDAVRIAIV